MPILVFIFIFIFLIILRSMEIWSPVLLWQMVNIPGRMLRLRRDYMIGIIVVIIFLVAMLALHWDHMVRSILFNIRRLMKLAIISNNWKFFFFSRDKLFIKILNVMLR